MVKPLSGGMLREVPSGYMAHYVIDASLALKWIWTEEDTDHARRYVRGALEGEMRLSVPSLFWYELTNALRFGSHRKTNASLSENPWELIRAVPIDTLEFVSEAFPIITELAARQNITVYDEAYVFLAQSLKVPLITSDKKLVESCANLPYVWLSDTI